MKINFKKYHIIMIVLFSVFVFLCFNLKHFFVSRGCYDIVCERKMKEAEAKELQTDVKINMQIANMTNKIYQTCLSSLDDCFTQQCGKGMQDCIGVNGIDREKIKRAGFSCYPAYRICMDTTARTLDVSNLSPQLRKRVMEINPSKMSEMAIDIVKGSLAEHIGFEKVDDIIDDIIDDIVESDWKQLFDIQ